MISNGYNWFLIVVTVVVCALSAVAALYLLIIYQHPEDANQAWLPKGIVILGITLCIWTILLFPLDIANRHACSVDLPASYCTFAIPSEQLWYACFIANAILTFVVNPFVMFYYEADSELSLAQRWLSAAGWEAATITVCALILGILYALVGYVQYPIVEVVSGMAPLSALNSSQLNACILPGTGPSQPQFNGALCDAVGTVVQPATWTLRCSFPVYLIALSATAGWVLFMMFAGVGFVALPVDMIMQFLGRPTATITKSEYIQRGRGLGNRAKAIKDVAESLRREEREMGRSRKWRSALRQVTAQLIALEEEHTKLELVYPQAEDPDYAWALTIIGFYLKLLGGVAGIMLTLAWLIHIILYLFVYPPVTPFLNSLFITLDGVFPLFGTLAFAIFCFYLIAVTIKGATKVGLQLLLFAVHPMKVGATLMSSFLFNVALMLLATNAAIQFCTQAFALYANESAIQAIWGDQILHLRGLKYLYELNVFVYCLMIFVAATVVFLAVRGPQKWRQRKTADAYAL